MGNVTYEHLDTMVTPKIYPQIRLTPVLEHEGDFVRLHHIDVEWPVGEGVEKYVPIRYVSKHVARVLDLETENAKLRELVDAWMGCGTRYHTMQGGCPMFDADAEDFCKAASLARDLGVEVD